MGKSSRFQICSSSLVCVAVAVVVAVSCLFFTCFLGSGLYGTFIVTVTVLVSSSVFLLKFTRKKKKKKVTFDENPAQEEDLVSCEVSTFVGDVQVCEKVEEKMQTLMGNEEENEAAATAAAQESAFSGKVSNFDLVGEKVEVKMQALVENDEQGSPFCGKVPNFQVGEKMQALMEDVEENEGVGFVKGPDFDFLSGSESSTSNDEGGANFEIDWICYNNVNGGHDQNEDMMRSSSDSISSEDDDDEDGLIEISIPGSEQEEEEEEEDQTNYKQKLGHDQERINMKQSQADSDFNEEENLIEIDISIGSIKCSRFEIEA